MCLIIKKADADHCMKTAEEDIICYKVLEWGEIFVNLGDGKCHSKPVFTTPYMKHDIEIGLHYIDSHDWLDIHPLSYSSYDMGVGTGVFHSYKNREDAESYKRMDLCVAKCIIPKGTEYIEGTYYNASNEECPSYGSKEIIVEKVLTPQMVIDSMEKFEEALQKRLDEINSGIKSCVSE